MSTESNEERIEQLENLVANLAAALKDLITLARAANEPEILKIKWLISLTDQQNIFIKLMCSNPAFGPQAERDKLLAQQEEFVKQWDDVILPFLRRTLLPPLPPGTIPPPAPPAPAV